MLATLQCRSIAFKTALKNENINMGHWWQCFCVGGFDAMSKIIKNNQSAALMVLFL